jgi:hypothetical protein
MAVEMKSVYSSHVDAVGYDEETGDLIVRWQSGKTSAYADVPEEVAKRVMSAPSVGEALHEEIKGSYDHRYL